MVFRYIILFLLLFFMAPNQIYCQDTNDDQVIAEVNGQKITIKAYNDAVHEKEKRLMIKLNKDEKMEVLNDMIDKIFLYKEALSKKYDELPEVITLLEKDKRDILINSLLRTEVTEKIKVTEDDLKKYYERNREKYEPTIITARVISISKVNRDKMPAENEAVKTAQEIRDRLVKGALPKDLIPEYTAKTDLILIDKSFINKTNFQFDESNKELVNRIFDMDLGTNSIFDFAGTIFVVNLLEKQQLTTSFEREKNRVVAELRHELWQTSHKDFISKLREHAEIKINNELIR